MSTIQTQINKLTIREKHLINEIHKHNLKIEAIERTIATYSKDLELENCKIEQNTKALELYKNRNQNDI